MPAWPDASDLLGGELAVVDDRLKVTSSPCRQSGRSRHATFENAPENADAPLTVVTATVLGQPLV
jgi:hypothetical protein